MSSVAVAAAEGASVPVAMAPSQLRTVFRRFWRDRVRVDEALGPLHRHPQFARLAAAYGRGGK